MSVQDRVISARSRTDLLPVGTSSYWSLSQALRDDLVDWVKRQMNIDHVDGITIVEYDVIDAPLIRVTRWDLDEHGINVNDDGSLRTITTEHPIRYRVR